MPQPRKTQEDKELRGTARKDRSEADFIQPEQLDDLPETPVYLNKIGRKHWKKYTKLLQNEGILAEKDLNMLGMYCMHLQIAEQAAEVLKDDLFRVSVNEQGEQYYVGTSAVLRQYNEASAAAFKMSQQFGFTPVSRKNVAAPKKAAKSRLSALKERHNSQAGTVLRLNSADT